MPATRPATAAGSRRLGGAGRPPVGALPISEALRAASDERVRRGLSPLVNTEAQVRAFLENTEDDGAGGNDSAAVARVPVHDPAVSRLAGHNSAGGERGGGGGGEENADPGGDGGGGGGGDEDGARDGEEDALARSTNRCGYCYESCCRSIRSYCGTCGSDAKTSAWLVLLLIIGILIGIVVVTFSVKLSTLSSASYHQTSIVVMRNCSLRLDDGIVAVRPLAIAIENSQLDTIVWIYPDSPTLLDSPLRLFVEGEWMKKLDDTSDTVDEQWCHTRKVFLLPPTVDNSSSTVQTSFAIGGLFPLPRIN